VVDSHGSWLAAHTARLARAGASHVRGPHTGHPLPQPLALQAFAERSRRSSELLASSPRFSPVPTAALFADFVAAQLPEALGRVELRRGTVTGLVREGGPLRAAGADSHGRACLATPSVPGCTCLPAGCA